MSHNEKIMKFKLLPHNTQRYESCILLIPVINGIPNVRSASLLEGAAMILWEYLSKGLSLDEIINSVSTNYSVDTETVLNDLNSLVENLKANNIIAED